MISAFFTLNKETIARFMVRFIPRIGDYIHIRSDVYIVTKVTRHYNEDGEVSIRIELNIPKV